MFTAHKVSAVVAKNCDRCNEPTKEDDNPIIELEYHEPSNYHCIRIHVKCFADVVNTVSDVNTNVVNGR